MVIGKALASRSKHRGRRMGGGNGIIAEPFETLVTVD
jgi:hypothetical protein